MNGWIWPALILALLILLLASRLRIRAEYDEDGIRITARFGVFTVFRHPGRNGKDQEMPVSKPRKKSKKPQKEEKKGGKLPDIRELLSIMGNTLGKLRRKLRVDELVLWYCSASKDPASAALGFGGASAAVGMLTAPLERAFRIRRRDIRTAVSFTDAEPTVILKLSISLSLFALLCLALPAVLRFFRAMRNRKD